MNRKSPAIIVGALALLLLTGRACALPHIKVKRSGNGVALREVAPLAEADFTSLTAAQIIEKLQHHIDSQKAVINNPRTKQALGILQRIVADTTKLAADRDTGKTLNQKLLDLLTQGEITVADSSGKAINSVSGTARTDLEKKQAIPDIATPGLATADEKGHIADLIKESKSLVPQVVDAQRAEPGLETIAMGLWKLAENDGDARNLVQKFGIKMNPPGGAAH